MTAHNGIVYEPSKNKPFARGLPYVATSRATDIEKVALLSPIRPDHFINKTFIAENIKITEFYNNLNKNLILMTASIEIHIHDVTTMIVFFCLVCRLVHFYNLHTNIS